MNQKLSNWASIAEIISGVAVVVTLLFLILEIRQGNDITRASMYSGFVDSLIELRRERGQDSELNALWLSIVGERVQELDETERARMIPYYQNIFSVYEKAYFTRQYGLLGDSEWSRFEQQICQQFNRVNRYLFFPVVLAVITQEFGDYIVAACRAVDE